MTKVYIFDVISLSGGTLLAATLARNKVYKTFLKEVTKAMAAKTQNRLTMTLIFGAIFYLAGIAWGWWTPTFGFSEVDRQLQEQGKWPYGPNKTKTVRE